MLLQLKLYDHIRFSVNDITQQIQELQKRFELIQSKLKKTTGDFKQQTEKCLMVHYSISFYYTVTKQHCYSQLSQV